MDNGRTVIDLQRIRLNHRRRYLVEIKKESDRGSFSRKKERVKFFLDDAIDFVNRSQRTKRGDVKIPLQGWLGKVSL